MEEFPQITNTGGLARTDFDPSTHDKLRPGDKVSTVDWGSFVVPSTLPANGFINREAPTWAGRLYAGSWVADRLADLKNTLSGGNKAADTIYFKDHTFDKNGIKDTTYKTTLKNGENWSKAMQRLYKTSDSVKSSK
ncbi:hypothetical protein [Chryseobacterium sediminis]|uniref:Uncharacterized protein n=1 Tax=Chryseobacterium sediminis TaxID=1679494 RepID=A0A5B2U2P5_9FLAO|nr:hypothetical protein [Chryseobacterium sediminis]KAA2220667.1 hypothetical protein FW780_17490 [Chryseobacterium sediminis]